MEMHDEMMLDYPPSLAAAKQLGEVPAGFAFFEFECLGDRPEEFTVMKVTGAVFREAKTGKNKGRRTVAIPGTERTVYVTAEAIRDATPAGYGDAFRAKLAAATE
ncbi:hypothetical protein E4T66_17515 [Sinimarinibacterium sp. CAU 1509]|uniref:hypothetical protein n=1 Tax=Sinimarinibacterium sp. CAU 1509 TaxID=2562283 RepID=UPI0010AC9AFC|nr:hypothetical protein [Sinimarinibacterium sp. CAU 1509]TJY57207.1 hypothetical protein E4T66_17515 [Sinimarinibacterium sp. CAU 1509]